MIEVTGCKVFPNKSGKGPTHFASVDFTIGGVAMYLRNCKVFAKKSDGQLFAKFPENEWKNKEGETQRSALFGFSSPGEEWKAWSNKLQDAIVAAVQKQDAENPAASLPTTGDQFSDDVPF